MQVVIELGGLSNTQAHLAAENIVAFGEPKLERSAFGQDSLQDAFKRFSLLAQILLSEAYDSATDICDIAR